MARVPGGAGRRRQDRARPAHAGDRGRPGLRARRRACRGTRRSTACRTSPTSTRFLADGPAGGGGALRAAGGAHRDGAEGAGGGAGRAAREAAGGDARRGRPDGRRGRGETGAVLFATWHSRFAPAVAEAKAWLAARAVARGRASSGRRTCGAGIPGRPGSGRPAGFGVFDPGINALSILTEILPGAVRGRRGARWSFPENCETPIAADFAMTGGAGLPGDASSSTGGRRARRPGTSPSRPTAAGSTCASAARRWRVDGARGRARRRSGSIR